MGVLNFKKKEEILKTIHSYSADDLQEWLEMDKKRMAMAHKEECLSRFGKLTETTH